MTFDTQNAVIVKLSCSLGGLNVCFVIFSVAMMKLRTIFRFQVSGICIATRNITVSRAWPLFWKSETSQIWHGPLNVCAVAATSNSRSPNFLVQSTGASCTEKRCLTGWRHIKLNVPWYFARSRQPFLNDVILWITWTRIFYPSGHWRETVTNAHFSAHFR